MFLTRIVHGALKGGAYAVVLAHNLPNSLVKPSKQDKTFVRIVVLAAEAVGLEVFGHLTDSVHDAFLFHEAEPL